MLVKVNIVVVRLAEALSLRNIFGLSTQRGM